MGHAVYSPDPALSHFLAFELLKTIWLASDLQTDADVKQAVTS
jgi:hypothetical protein